jgi:predicted nuclease of predicted toxin-antitoxin system
MRFLADESVEWPLVDRLRQEGYEVDYVTEDCRGAEDPAVLELAAERHCILITNDKDFAELAFLQKQANEGIVLLRLARLRSATKAERVLDVLRELRERLSAAMTVIEEHAARRRPFAGER